jgi:hypothetical protein
LMMGTRFAACVDLSFLAAMVERRHLSRHIYLNIFFIGIF